MKYNNKKTQVDMYVFDRGNMTEIECDNCHKKFKIYDCYLKRERKHRFCSKKCEGEFKSYKNSIEHWRGGWISPTNGYKYVEYEGKPISSVLPILYGNMVLYLYG